MRRWLARFYALVARLRDLLICAGGTFLVTAIATGRVFAMPTDPTLVLSAGLLMLGASETGEVPSTSTANYVVVPPGEFLLAFPSVSYGSRQIFALTESGIWGYIKRNTDKTKWYLEENPLRRIYENGISTSANFLFITEPYKIPLNGVPVTFGRGEIYQESGSDPTQTVWTLDHIPSQKQSDIQKQATAAGIKGYTVPLSVDIPSDYGLIINTDTIDRVVAPTPFTTTPKNQKQDMHTLLMRWRKTVPQQRYTKGCNQKLTKDSLKDYAGTNKVADNVDVGGHFWNIFDLHIKHEGELGLTSENKSQEITDLPANIDHRMFSYKVTYGDQRSVEEINVFIDQKCQEPISTEEPATPLFSLEIADQGLIQFGQSTFFKEHPDLNPLMDDTTGQALLQCYSDYRKLRQAIEPIAQDGVDFFLIHFERIKEVENFFVPCNPTKMTVAPIHNSASSKISNSK
jgi:hypothetical protein